jgi:16S rRNA processing protein RimM
MAVQGGIRTGKISKPYGLRGEVQIILTPGSAPNIKKGDPLFIDIDGQRVPFFIEGADLFSSDQAIIKLEFIDSVEDARKVSGCEVYLESARNTGRGKENPGNMVGYFVSDPALGHIGKITKCILTEMNPVWIIESGGKELMVPAAAEFIVKIDHRQKKILLNLPEGLTDL